MSANDSTKRLHSDVAWNLIPVALLAVVGLGMNFVISRWWGKAALGAFNQVTTIYFVASVVAALGINYSVLREVAAAAARQDQAHIAASVVGGVVPTIAVAAVLALALASCHATIGRAFDSALVAEGVRWVAPGLFCFSINKMLLATVNGLGRMRAFAAYTSLRYLLIAGGLVMAHACQLSAGMLPGIWTFAEGALLLVLLAEVAATVSLRAAKQWRHACRTHLQFGMRGFWATFAFELNSRIDVWVLGLAMSDAAVGVYSMAASIYEGAQQIPVVVQNTVNPQLAVLFAGRDRDQFDTLRRTVRRWFVPLFATACAAGALAFPALIPALAGDASYRAGSWPFAIFMLGLIGAAPFLPFVQILMMAGQPSAHTRLMVAWALVNIVGTTVLVHVVGFLGAALSATGTLWLFCWLLRRTTRTRLDVEL